MPVPPPPGARMVVGLPTSGSAAKPAHLVTPDLEAHCQKILHRDGLIILEGNVLLLYKKDVQPLRIEANRVIINTREGTVIVDPNTSVLPTVTFGVMRTTQTPAYAPYPTATQVLPQRIIELPVTQTYPR